MDVIASVRRQFQQSGQGRRLVIDLVPADHLRPGYQENSFTFCEANAPLAVNNIEFMTQAQHRGLQAGCFRHHAGRRIRFPADKRRMPADNSGFFPPDTFAVITKILLVVQPDGCNDRAVRIQDIHRIQAPTQADFHDGKIQSGPFIRKIAARVPNSK